MLLSHPEPSTCKLSRKLQCCIIDVYLGVNTNFPTPLTFQDCTVKGSQLKVTCELNVLSVSVSWRVLRPVLSLQVSRRNILATAHMKLTANMSIGEG